MKILVTGAAGYVGREVSHQLVKAGHDVLGLDNHATGIRRKKEPIPIFNIDLTSMQHIDWAFRTQDFDAVVHTAGYKWAGESVLHPLRAYANTTMTINLMAAMTAFEVPKIVFSSSAAIYAATDEPLTESSPVGPQSPYGHSKLMCEQIIEDVCKARGKTAVSLRYMNVVGGSKYTYDTSPYNLLPMVYKQVKAGGVPAIFGTDYPTDDGTCVRDYVNIKDLAKAHVAAVEKSDIAPVYNLGSGGGYSVREVLNCVRNVSGEWFDPVDRPKRPGDPAKIICDSSMAERDLGFRAGHSLEDSVRSHWTACSGK